MTDTELKNNLSIECASHFVRAYKAGMHDYDIPGETYEDEGVSEYMAVFVLQQHDFDEWPELNREHNRLAIEILVNNDGDEDAESVSTYFVEDE